MNKALKKTLKIAAIALIAIVVLAMLVLMGFKAYDRIKYNSFYSNAQREFAIPGLKDGYVPQGFDYHDGEKVFLSCGYMSNGKSSRVYVIDKYGNYTYTELRDEYNNAYTGHTGGIAYYNDFLYITGSDGVDVFSLEDVLKGEEKTALRGTIGTYGINPAFCFIHDGELFAGAFHKDGDYDTPMSHHIEVKPGEVNKALMVTFKLSDAGVATYGVDPAPRAVYSLPSYVQGITVTEDNKMMLSTSWGLTTSKIYIHDFKEISGEFNGTAYKTTVIGDKELPLYYVSSDSLIKTVEAPPMAEEILYQNGRIWIMNESACNKYIFGKITTGNYLYSYEYQD
ncbi:MAG: hypothetical protein J6B29_06345 [Clostridia bacterium]|nr:hypothetical protein [Clostridia bacterium]